MAFDWAIIDTTDYSVVDRFESREAARAELNNYSIIYVVEYCPRPELDNDPSMV